MISDPLTDQMAEDLVQWFLQRDGYGYTSVDASFKDRLDALCARGMFEAGQYVYGGQWIGDKQPIVHINPAYYMVRFTNRGEAEAWRLIKAKEARLNFG
jgi:hypothetical protein